jgi:transcriptional regulator with XRE-family HTH domain
VNERSELIARLQDSRKYRASYIRAKLSVLIPSQIRALRQRQTMTQTLLASEAEMAQPRISAMERPGATKFNMETLIRLAAAFRVGLVVKFVAFSDLLKWENRFSQDQFHVLTLDEDLAFLDPRRVASAMSDEFSQPNEGMAEQKGQYGGMRKMLAAKAAAVGGNMSLPGTACAGAASVPISLAANRLES